MPSREIKCFSRRFQAQPHRCQLQLYKAEKHQCELVCWTSSLPPAGRSSELNHVWTQTQTRLVSRISLMLIDVQHRRGIFYSPCWPATPAKSLKAERWKNPEGEHWLWSDSSGLEPAREEPQVGSDRRERGEHQLFLEAPHGWCSESP